MLKIKSLSFSYQNKTSILNTFNLSVKRNSITVINGKSACGKSTFLNLVSGKIGVPKDFSKITFDGISFDKISENKKISLIGYLTQNPDWQLCSSTAYQEIRFGLENIGFENNEIEEKCRNYLKLSELTDLKDISVHALSGGQKQKLILSAILALNKKIILFDEPFAHLDINSIIEFVTFLKEIKSSHETHIIICEHKSHYLENIADQLFTLDNGSLKKYQEKPEPHISVFREKKIAKELIRTNKLTFQINDTKILNNISISFFEGERVAIIGKNGSGKSTFVQSLSSLINFSGELNVIGKVGHVFQNPDLMLIQSHVSDEIIDDNIINMLDLTKQKNQYPQTLSKGQRFRCAVGLALQSNVDILILDEPSSGQDVSHINYMIKAIHNSRIKMILFCSHDIEFILTHANRFIVLDNGKIVRDFKKDERSLSVILEIFQLKSLP